MLVDEQCERQAAVAELLASADCELIAVLTSADDLLDQVLEQQPDVVIIDLDSPGRDTLESLQTVQSRMPRPMVMFSQDDQGESIRRAVQAGVSAYVVDGIQAKRVRPILEAAMARFAQFQRLEQALDKARGELAERKRIERAKGIVMARRGLGEEEAYRLLRRAAMDQNKRLAEIAEAVIAASALLSSTATVT